ncbi:MAG: IS200/IS605 family transposase [Paludibacteraceae bacterium]|jgi:REP element-mobilizing transposase RayT|nr:IS200/IS605 family transposase [Paludibacteraceae bacterium]
MANTYTQIIVHIVFAVKDRQSLISPHWKDNLYQYITGTIQREGNKLLSIGGTNNHIHILIGIKPAQSLSDIVYKVKKHSTEWINSQKLCIGRFGWQSGFGAFSYSKSLIPIIIDYIEKQEEHHRKKTFREEYLQLLRKTDINFEEDYVFYEP